MAVHLFSRPADVCSSRVINFLLFSASVVLGFVLPLFFSFSLQRTTNVGCNIGCAGQSVQDTRPACTHCLYLRYYTEYTEITEYSRDACGQSRKFPEKIKRSPVMPLQSPNSRLRIQIPHRTLTTRCRQTVDWCVNFPTIRTSQARTLLDVVQHSSNCTDIPFGILLHTHYKDHPYPLHSEAICRSMPNQKSKAKPVRP